MGAHTPTAMLGMLCLVVPLLAVPATIATAQDGPTITSQVVESFDGTPIVTHLFLPPGASDDTPVPLVMRTHGWGGTGETGVGGTLEVLLDNGYAVMTWDQRGFGCSGGVVHTNKPEVEGRDVSALIDWAMASAPIATDTDGDPIVGFTGGSYAGAIQTATTSTDPRVDAIAPEIAWEDLRYSLYGGEVVKQGWAALLYAAGTATATALGLSPACPGFAEYGPQEGGLHPLIHQGFAEGASSGTVSDEVLEFFAESSLAVYGQDSPVAIPTLVMQGSVDTLFNLTDGYRQFQHVRANGAPAKFVAFCGGHVACPEFYGDAGDRAHMNDLIVAWFDRYLKGDTSVETGPTVEYRTNDAEWRSASDFPPAEFTWVDGSGEGSVISIPALDSPSADELADTLINLGSVAPTDPITVAQPASEAELGAGQAFQFEVGTAAGPVELLGIPEVSLTVSGQGDEVILFVKLIHREQNHVVNLQEGAIRVPLGDGEVTVDVTMPGIAYTLPDGHHFDLEVSTVSLMHSNARTPSSVDVLAAVSVPAGIAGEAPPDPTEPAPAPVIDTPDLPSTGAGVGLLALLVGLVAGTRRPRRRD